MTFVQGLVTFFLIWWTFIFCILPFYYRPQEEGEQAVDRPKPKFSKIFINTTLLSVVVWLIVYGLIQANVIDFYALAQHMAIKDGLQ